PAAHGRRREVLPRDPDPDGLRAGSVARGRPLPHAEPLEALRGDGARQRQRRGRVQRAARADLQAIAMTTGTSESKARTMVTDPVCGMTIAAEDAAAAVDHGGQTYYFCAEGCARRFREDPRVFLAPSGSGKATAPAPAGIEYTCPMHPEVRQIGPGTCPKCGMALEPRTASAEEENPELAEMTRRLWISTALTIPLLLFMVADMFADRQRP